MYARSYTQGRSGNAGLPFSGTEASARPETVLIPEHYRGELLRPAEPEQTVKETDSHPPEPLPTAAENAVPELLPERTLSGLLSGKEDTLLLCAVGILLYSGQQQREKREWEEEDLALLLILLLLIS